MKWSFEALFGYPGAPWRHSAAVVLAGAYVVALLAGLLAAPADLAAQARYPEDQVIPDFADKFAKINWSRDGDWPRGDCGDLRDAYGRALTDCSIPWPEVQVNERGRAWLQYMDIKSSPTLNECAAVVTPGILGDVRPFNFLFRQDRLIITYEHAGMLRNVWMDGRTHPPPTDLFYEGHAIGWWEDETLVIETQNFTFNPDGLDDHIHLGASERRRVVERYDSTDDDKLMITITYEDPVFLNAPVTWQQRWVREAEPMDGWWECHPEVTRREIELTYPDKYDNP
jgi:hypothetical protein